MYFISVAVAYVLHLCIEGPVIAADALVFKKRQSRDSSDLPSSKQAKLKDEIISEELKAVVLSSAAQIKSIYKF